MIDSLKAELAARGTAFEHSMDTLHRKQTGSYYTSINLTDAMMNEMLASMPTEWVRSLPSKRFFEPCVGTGNFVISYIIATTNYGFSQDEYRQMINNIYVCDINTDALNVYKDSLARLAISLCDYALDDIYFQQHVGSGLLFDVDSDAPQYIPVTDVFPASIVQHGFDIVVTNPPYKNLKAEKSHYPTLDAYNRDKMKYSHIAGLAGKLFPCSAFGSINLYRLFVEEIIEKYAAPESFVSLLIPASFLSDKTCEQIRLRLLDTTEVTSIKVIAEGAGFVSAQQALCALLCKKGNIATSTISITKGYGSANAKPVSIDVRSMLDSRNGNAIQVLTESEYALVKQLKQFPVISDLPYVFNLRGELDITLNSESIHDTEQGLPLLRGRNIGYYRLSGIPSHEYVDDGFIGKTAKKRYTEHPRIICQQIVNMAKKRRVSYSYVPAGYVLANSCNFLAIEDNPDGIDLFFLLGVLNSSIIDWYFRLSSSNNHINNYEIATFPIPVDSEYKTQISDLVKLYLQDPDETVIARIDGLVNAAYGLQPTGEIIHQSENRLHETFSYENQLLVDLRHIVPEIDTAQCKALIESSLSIDEVLLMLMSKSSSFEKTVVANIVRKYRILAFGGILNHTTFKLSDLDLEMIKSVPQGGSWKDIPESTVAKSRRLLRITESGGRTTLYGRIDYHKPAYTITTYFNRPGNGTYVHPNLERVISVREACRFQSIPDNYYICGNKTQMLKQVGNAVPSLLAYQIGRRIVHVTGCKHSIDLFCGAGGMTYGFKVAGIISHLSNDIEESACITLKVNNPEINVLCGDITSKETKDAIFAVAQKQKIDIICGGPPCQGFSMAGFRKADDPRNQLFRDFVSVVSEIKPKVIVFENVEGLLTFQGGETYKSILELFSELGYKTEGRLLIATDYAIPQKRKRVIIICTRNDQDYLPSDLFPPKVTPDLDYQIDAEAAISDLEGIVCSEEAHCQESGRESSKYLRAMKNLLSWDKYIEYCSRFKKDDSRSTHTHTTVQQNNSIPKQMSFFDLI